MKSSIRNKAMSTEKLQLTRVHFRTAISKTSIVETAIVKTVFEQHTKYKIDVAKLKKEKSKEKSKVKFKTVTCTQVAHTIINTFKIDNCFHKKEANKSNNFLNASMLRVRHHVTDNLKKVAYADKLYNFDNATDSITLTEKYLDIINNDKQYRSHLKYMFNILIAKKAKSKTAKKAKSKTA